MPLPERYNTGYNVGVGGAVVQDGKLLLVRRASRRSSCKKVPRALTPHARVRLVCRRRLVRQIGELVHDRLRLKCHNRLAKRDHVEDVANERFGTQIAQQIQLVRAPPGRVGDGGAHGHAGPRPPGAGQRGQAGVRDRQRRLAHAIWAVLAKRIGRTAEREAK